MTKLASLKAMLVSNFSKQVSIKLTSESDLEFHLKDGKSVLIDLFKVCMTYLNNDHFKFYESLEYNLMMTTMRRRAYKHCARFSQGMLAPGISQFTNSGRQTSVGNVSRRLRMISSFPKKISHLSRQ